MGRKTSNNVWMDTFQNLQGEKLGADYGQVWNLHFQYDLDNDLTPEQREQGWKIHKDNSFGSFRCSKCSNVWKSACVPLIFHYRRVEKGAVRLRVFRQQCRRCKYPGLMKPMPEEDDVREVLMRLIKKIRRNCYNEDQGPRASDRRHGDLPLTKPHESNLCEACMLGSCSKSLTRDKRPS